MTKKQQAQIMLGKVNQAIIEIVGGAVSASIASGTGSKSYTRADLGTLQTMRRDLRLEIASYVNSGRPRITMSGARFV